MKRSALWVAGALSLAGAFFAGAAYAAETSLDQATSLVTQAVASLKAAENPEQQREFRNHRLEAIELLVRAQGEILKAKQFADAPPTDPSAPKAPTPKAPKQ